MGTLIRKAGHAPVEAVGFRHVWGQSKLSELTDTAELGLDAPYNAIEPVLPLGLPFTDVTFNRSWQEWPALPDLLPASFPGVVTGRGGFPIDADLLMPTSTA